MFIVLFDKPHALCVWLKGQVSKSNQELRGSKFIENDTQFSSKSPDNVTRHQNAYYWTNFCMWVPALGNSIKSLR